MSDARSLLLEDARQSLVRIVRTYKGMADHREAFAAWLVGGGIPEMAQEPLCQMVVNRPVNQKSYRDVATLGYAAAASASGFSHGDLLREQLSWLAGREILMAGSPAGFSTDPVALLGFALGAHAVADGMLLNKVQGWVSGFATAFFETSHVSEHEKYLVIASLRLLELPAAHPIDRSDRTADIRVALRARNLLPPVHPSEDDRDATSTLGLVLEGTAGLLPLVAAFRLAALESVNKSVRSALTPLPSLGSSEVAPMIHPVKVMLSYAWEKDPTHGDTALSLANDLRSRGIASMIDQYVTGTPAEGWPTWMLQQVKDSDFILVVCSETYCRRFERYEDPGLGKGAKWEGAIITQSIYEDDTNNRKFIPVMLKSQDISHIPLVLKSATRYDLSDAVQYDKLYRYLTGQPSIVMPPLGTPVALPPRDVKPFRPRS